MKKKETLNKKLFCYEIDRGEEETTEQKEPLANNVSMINGRYSMPDYATTVGYHFDPSHYDSLRDPEKFAKKIKNSTPAISHGEYVGGSFTSKSEIEYRDGTRKNNQANFNNSQINSYNSNEESSYENVQDNRIEASQLDSFSQYETSENENANDTYNNYEEVFEEDNINTNNYSEPIQPQNKPSYSETVQKNNSRNEQNNVRPVTINQNKQTIYKPSTNEVEYRKYGRYVRPSLDFLNKKSIDEGLDQTLINSHIETINTIIKENGIKAHVDSYIVGPTVIEYLIAFDSYSEKVESLKRIEANLAMYLEVANVRLLLPIPKKHFAGIEVPRPSGKRGLVCLGDMLSKEEFINSKMQLPIAVGRNSFNEDIFADIDNMPHGLCAGTSRSGKSVCLKTIIMSLIYHLTPDEAKIILIDPKIVEFSSYEDIPHLAMPIITEEELFPSVLEWLTNEMERRYKLLNSNGCVNLGELNKKLVSERKAKVPYIVMIMDEFSEWFDGIDESVITTFSIILQKSRAAGIHVILAAQHPSADVVKGKVKANLNARFAFLVSSSSDSQIVLNQGGAEKLEGNGDMIFRTAGEEDERLQGAFVSNEEVQRVVDFIRQNNEPNYYVTIEELKQSTTQRGEAGGVASADTGKNDPLFNEVAYYVVRNDAASMNRLTQEFKAGFNRIKLIFNDLIALGIVSQAPRGGTSKVLVNELELEDILENI